MFHALLVLPAVAVFGTVAGTVLTVLFGLLGLAFIAELLFGFVFQTVKWLLWLPGVLGMAVLGVLGAVNEIVPKRRIIGIFDLDKCSYEKRTRDYLARAEREGVVLDVSGELPKSFVVCDHPYHAQIVYLSQLNTSTLKNRAESEKPVL